MADKTKSEMLQEAFAEIVAEAISTGYSRGLEIFMESVEEDLSKAEVFEEGVTVADVAEYLVESSL